jgi:hypothetical protein
MSEEYNNPYLSRLIKEYKIDSKKSLIAEIQNDISLGKELEEHLNIVQKIHTKRNTFDGYYCLKNYPNKGRYSFVYQEKGMITELALTFTSYAECLVFGLVGETDLEKWS